MAELLIKATDHTHPNATTDRLGAYKRGDVVTVKPDGHRWGDDEGLPHFYRITVSSEAVARYRRYEEDEFSGSTILTKRWRYFDIDGLSAAQQATLASTGRLSLRRAQADGHFRRKTNGQRTPSDPVDAP